MKKLITLALLAVIMAGCAKKQDPLRYKGCVIVHKYDFPDFNIRVKLTPSLTRAIIPSWSLSALLELMPILLKGYWRWILTRHNGGYSCTYLNGGETFHSEGGNTDIDAAYNMVVYLVEQGYIKTEKK